MNSGINTVTLNTKLLNFLIPDEGAALIRALLQTKLRGVVDHTTTFVARHLVGTFLLVQWVILLKWTRYRIILNCLLSAIVPSCKLLRGVENVLPVYAHVRCNVSIGLKRNAFELAATNTRRLVCKNHTAGCAALHVIRAWLSELGESRVVEEALAWL